MIGEHPVVLFGHAPVEATQTGLDVDQGNIKRVGGEGAAQRGVGIALHDDRQRRVFGEGSLESPYCVTDLSGASRPTDAEVEVGVEKAELAEEHIG